MAITYITLSRMSRKIVGRHSQALPTFHTHVPFRFTQNGKNDKLFSPPSLGRAKGRGPCPVGGKTHQGIAEVTCYLGPASFS